MKKNFSRKRINIGAGFGVIRSIISTTIMIVILAIAPLSFARAAETSYNIDVILPLTGFAAFLGRGEKVALQVLERTVNAKGGVDHRPLHFTFFDDETKPALDVQLVSRILASNPAVIIGPSLESSCDAVMPLLKKGPVDYCLSPGVTPAKGSYVYAYGVSVRNLIATQINYFRLKGITRIAYITSTDTTGQEAAKRIKSILDKPENRSISLVAKEYFNPSSISVAAQIERIQAAHPQALFAYVTGQAVATVFKGIVAENLEVPVATSMGNMTYAQMKAYHAFLPKMLYINSTEWPLASGTKRLPAAVSAAKAEFFAAFKDQRLPPPDVAEVQAWDPGLIIVSALEKLGLNATSAQVKSYIDHLADFPGINGIYNFVKTPQRGLDRSDAVITRWNPQVHTWQIVSAPRGVPLGR